MAESIEGMMSPFSMSVIDALLTTQDISGIKGDAVEMGCFAENPQLSSRDGYAPRNSCTFYDINDYFDRDAWAKTGASIDYTIASTSDLSARHFKSLRKSVRFCHVDASHMFEPTLHEMAMADSMLSADGILCLDDFTYLNTPDSGGNL